MTVETHILDFDKDIYAEEIKVLFMEKMREERRFHSADELKEQLKSDIAERRNKNV